MLFTVTQSGYGGDVTGRKRDIDYLQGEIQELFADLWQVPGFAGVRRGFRRAGVRRRVRRRRERRLAAVTRQRAPGRR